MAEKQKPLFYQGVRDCSDFNHYLEDWIIPSTLGDLETVFEGATRLCADYPHRARGNFILATALFAVMDHLGTFLRDPNDPEGNWKNISMCAQQLPSIRKVHTIIAFCGRNALVHSAWPQTMIVVADGARTLRFGLNISADADISKEHRKLYWRQYAEPNPDSCDEQYVLKLRLNVYALLDELAHCIRERKLVDYPNAFDNVQQLIARRCYFTARGDRLEINQASEPRPGKTLRQKTAKEWTQALLAQIRYLYDNAPIMGQEIMLPIEETQSS